MQLPPIVSKEEWQRAHEALLAKEKEATRARDALAAERRRQPRLEFSTDHRFEGPDADPQTPPYQWWRPHDAYEEER
jgi:predicted dithiol-disulfide oxidoreductase (DUF899 family)